MQRDRRDSSASVAVGMSGWLASDARDEPVDVLRLALSGWLASDARDESVDVLRLAVRPGARFRKGGEAPLEVG